MVALSCFLTKSSRWVDSARTNIEATKSAQS